jgi:hypothetical protein
MDLQGFQSEDKSVNSYLVLSLCVRSMANSVEKEPVFLKEGPITGGL